MLAEVIRDNGYQTHCVGKTHFYPQRKHCGFEGLDSYEAFQQFNEYYKNDYHEWLKEKTGNLYSESLNGLYGNSWVARPSALPEHLHVNSWTVTKAIEFIEKRDHTRPYFLNVSFLRPHPPIDPPQAYWDEYMDIPLDRPKVGAWAKRHEVAVTGLEPSQGVLNERDLKKCRHGYFAQIAHIDIQIGRLIHYLRRFHGMPDMIVFTSDHGEMLFDHNLFRKSCAYEGSSAVPLIIWTKDKHKINKSKIPVVLEDIYPTILDYAGIDIPKDVDGLSLMPIVKADESLNREFIHGEHSSSYVSEGDERNIQYLTDGNFKYIWFTISGKEQLFNLKDDPYELNDLADKPEHKDSLIKWRKRLVRLLSKPPYSKFSDGENLICGCIMEAYIDFEKDNV